MSSLMISQISYWSKLFLTVLTHCGCQWCLLVLFLLVFLLYPLYRTPEILRLSLPVVRCFVELCFRFSKVRFLLYLVLSDDVGLNQTTSTCYLDVSLFAYELNSFLFDMKTNLHAFACFSRAFLLNFRPQPSGHMIKSFSVSTCSLASSTSSSLMGF